MQYEFEKLKEEFETEIWLYLEGSISEERKTFWEERFVEFPELKDEFDLTLKTLNLYNDLTEDDVLDSKFETMVEKSTGKKESLFANLFKGDDRTLKLVFGGTLAAASLVILLLSNKPNPVKNISGDLLDWNSEKINTQISDIGKSLLFMKDKEARQYFQNKLASDKWTRDIYNINRSIQKMKNEMKESSF